MRPGRIARRALIPNGTDSMTLNVYNTQTRSVDPFSPLVEGQVGVYACGPTIYNHAHIGNFRTFLFFDTVHRYLEASGYDVRFVMNLTDVDDKTIAGAIAADMSVADFTRPFAEAFFECELDEAILCFEFLVHRSLSSSVRSMSRRSRRRMRCSIDLTPSTERPSALAIRCRDQPNL